MTPPKIAQLIKQNTLSKANAMELSGYYTQLTGIKIESCFCSSQERKDIQTLVRQINHDNEQNTD